MQLLDTHYAVLDPALRRGLVKALILLRNKGQLSAVKLHPLLFRLFRCQDKDLRQMLFRHIVSGVSCEFAVLCCVNWLHATACIRSFN